MTSNPSFPIDTAAVNWLDGGGQVHIRVYSSDGYNVTERCWDGDGWTTGGFAQQGAVVSATSWQGGGGLSIRVYCTFQDKTTEWCWDQGGDWYVGAYTTG
jgi:hypothetical protein